MKTEILRVRSEKARRRLVLTAGALGVVMVAAIAMRDAQAQAQGGSTVDCTAFRGAAQTAMTNHLAIVNTFMGDASQSAQNAITSRGSCINGTLLASLDLSSLIPDFGLLGSLLSNAIGRLVDSMVNKVCAAANGAIQGVAGSWNSVVGKLNGQLDVNGAVQDWGRGVSYQISDVDRLTGGGGSSGGSSTPIVSTVPSLPQTCYQTPNGRVCTDGTTSSTGGITNPGDTGQSGAQSGAQIGTRFAELAEACTAAVAVQRRMDFTDQGGSNMVQINQACGQMQAYLYQYAPYIDPYAIPSASIVPQFNLVIPVNAGTGTGSATFGAAATGGTTEQRSSFSLPVR